MEFTICWPSPGRPKTVSVTMIPRQQRAEVDAELGNHGRERARAARGGRRRAARAAPWHGPCGCSPHRGHPTWRRVSAASTVAAVTRAIVIHGSISGGPTGRGLVVSRRTPCPGRRSPRPDAGGRTAPGRSNSPSRNGGHRIEEQRQARGGAVGDRPWPRGGQHPRQIPRRSHSTAPPKATEAVTGRSCLMIVVTGSWLTNE